VYSAGNSQGSTLSSTGSWRTGLTVKASQSTNFLFASGSFDASVGAEYGETSADSTSLAMTLTSSYNKPGEVDAVDHGNDEIWFVAHPTLDVTIHPSSGEVDWQFDRAGSPVEYFVYVHELMDPSTMPPDVQQTLAGFGITPSSYGNLLLADPFAHGATPGQFMDTVRYDFIQSFPYVPVGAPGDRPSTQTFTIAHSSTNSSMSTSSVTLNTSITIGGSASFFGLVSARLSATSTFSWTHSSSKLNSIGTTQTDTLAIGQPRYTYAGPTILRVYFDKIWKTYVFSLDWT
jgi:hypothetical protein